MKRRRLTFLVSRAGRLQGSLPSAEEIRRGLSTKALDQLRNDLKVSDEQIAEIVRVPRTTLNRRRAEGHLTPEESDRAANLMRAFAQAMEYFDGDREAARRWMQHPAKALGGETPLKRCDTATGVQEVIDLLERLAHGIPT